MKNKGGFLLLRCCLLNIKKLNSTSHLLPNSTKCRTLHSAGIQQRITTVPLRYKRSLLLCAGRLQQSYGVVTPDLAG